MAAATLPFVVGGLREVLRRVEHLFGGHTEPPIEAAADDLAARNEHETGRNDGQKEQGRDELRAESREWDGLPLIEPELQQVAREHEEQRGQNRQIDGVERVEHDIAQQRRDLGRAVGDADEAEEHGDERHHGDRQRARAVQRAPARLGRCGGGRHGAEAQRMNVKSARPVPSSCPQGGQSEKVRRGVTCRRTCT